MISREKYSEYLKQIALEEQGNSNLKYLKRKYKRMSSVIITCGVLMLFLAFFVTFSEGLNVFFITTFVGASLIVLGIVRANNTSKSKKYYKNNYKDKAIGWLLEGYEYSFDRYGQISSAVFDKSQFAYYDYDKYLGTDKLIINIPNNDGRKSNNYLNLCDLKVTRIEKNEEGNAREVTVYNGVFGYIEFPFEFKCTLCVNTKYGNGGKLEKVKLEDINFNKMFKVYSNDQIESRCILTPDMMTYLYDLNMRLGGLKLTITGNNMYLGFNYFDMLELADYKSDNIDSMFKNFYDEIEALLSLVEEIKNNDKVFKI